MHVLILGLDYVMYITSGFIFVEEQVIVPGVFYQVESFWLQCVLLLQGSYNVVVMSTKE